MTKSDLLNLLVSTRLYQMLPSAVVDDLVLRYPEPRIAVTGGFLRGDNWLFQWGYAEPGRRPLPMTIDRSRYSRTFCGLTRGFISLSEGDKVTELFVSSDTTVTWTTFSYDPDHVVMRMPMSRA